MAQIEHEQVGSAAHGHHHHAPLVSGSQFRSALLLTTLILMVEIAGGLAAHSLALLSDAGHILTDIAALGLAWFASGQADRPADARKTYGYHRTGILVALANALTLIAIVAAIAFEAVRRLQHPTPVTPGLMFVAALAGAAVNLYIVSGLRQESTDNLNVRAALLHVVGDIAASLGVVAGGLVIVLTGWNAVDPIISLLIAGVIGRGAWSVLAETLGILMEAAPRGLDLARLARDVKRVPGVSEVHDLHVWSIAGGMSALSAHLLVHDDSPLSDCDVLLERVNQMLADSYRITHTTIQLEYDCCGRHEPSEIFCVQGGCAPEPCDCAHRRLGQAGEPVATR